MAKKKAKAAPTAAPAAAVPSVLTEDEQSALDTTPEEEIQKEPKGQKELEAAEQKVAALEKRLAELEASASDDPLPDEDEEEFVIMIPSSSDFDGKEDVFVNANGRRFLLQRDVEVSVPAVVVNALRDAVKVEHQTDAAGRITGSRQVARYPFQMISKPKKEKEAKEG